MLSDTQTRLAKPGPRDAWLADGGGLYLRIRSSGVKSWVVRRKRHGRTEVVTLGRYPGLTLSEAREKTRALDGHAPGRMTFGELLDEWYADQIEPRYRRPRQVRQYVDRVAPALRAKKLREIGRADLRAFLKLYARERGPVGANRLLAILKQACDYAVEAGYLSGSPISGLSRKLVGGDEAPRNRVLGDDELRKLWHSESHHTPLLRFLLLTGQRIGEAQRAAREDVAGGRWEIPDNKSKRPHWCPLSRQAHALLEAQPHDRRFMFGSASNTAVQAWLKRWCEREKIVPAFTPHDLRRTVATRMNELGIAPHVVEKILNHALQGVMRIYNQAEYATERIEAMQRWADELAAIDEGRP